MDGLPADLAWVYPYTEYARAADDPLEQPQLRPVVAVDLGSRFTSQRHLGLVDSGADAVLAPRWVADEIGVELAGPPTHHRMGGHRLETRFAHVRLRLWSPEGALQSDAESAASAPLEWEAQVGFYTGWDDPPWVLVLGQCGFFDHFTVILNRLSAALAIRPVEHFDQNYPAAVAPRG